MNIALVIEHFDPTRGGAEAVAVFIAAQLAQRGQEIHVLCHDARRRIKPLRSAHLGASHDARRSARSHPPEAFAPPPGVTVHRLRGFKLSTAVGFRLFGLQVARWCRRHRPDLVHSLSVAYAGDIYHPEAGTYAGLQRAAVESRLHAHQAAAKRFLLRLPGKARTLIALEKKTVRPPTAGGAHKIICISQLMRDEFREIYHLPESRLIRLDNPRLDPMPDPAALPPLREWFRAHYHLDPADRVAAFVGHDFRRKGLWWALHALAHTRTPWKLLVVGLGKVRPFLELAERLGLTDRVRFVGPTRQTDAVYAAADALLLPTFYDSFGQVAVEALSYGLPVIATRRLGCYPLIADNHLGAIVDTPRDTPALAAALDSLPTPGPALTTLAAQCRQAAEGLAPAQFLTQLEALYQSLHPLPP